MLGCLLVLTAAVVYLGWSSRQRRLVYVDSAKLLDGYQAMAEARKAYATKAQRWQANVDTLAANVQRAIREHERKAAAMSIKERELSTQLLRRKQQELVNYQRANQQTAQQEESKATQQVLTQVNSFLTRYGEAHDYDLILVASPAGTIAYARPGLDVTEDVVRELNQGYNKPQR